MSFDWTNNEKLLHRQSKYKCTETSCFKQVPHFNISLVNKKGSLHLSALNKFYNIYGVL